MKALHISLFDGNPVVWCESGALFDAPAVRKSAIAGTMKDAGKNRPTGLSDGAPRDLLSLEKEAFVEHPNGDTTSTLMGHSKESSMSDFFRSERERPHLEENGGIR